MRRHASQRGAALILLLGIIATLAILSATLVFVLANQQGATANERRAKQSLYAADAAVDTGVQWAKTYHAMSTTVEWLTPAELAAAFNATYPAGASVVYRVYDNLATVNYNIKWDQGSPTSATTPDGMVWLETTVTYQGKKTRARVLIHQYNASIVSGLPKAAAYSDTGISLEGTSDIYAVKRDGVTPWAPAPPYATTIMAGGGWVSGWPTAAKDVVIDASANLAAPTSSVQSVNIWANGTVSRTFPGTDTSGKVGLLSDYFDQAAQADLGDEAQSGNPTQANAAGTVVSTTLKNTLQSTTAQTYTAGSDLVVNGDLTLRVNSGSSTFNFRSLYVTGNLTLTGNVTLNTTALYVGGNLTISGATTGVIDQVGPLFIGGSATWSGVASVKTTNYLNVAAAPGPMWIGTVLAASGTYNHVFGPTWISGNAGTSDVAIRFTGPASGTACTVMCPLMATTEKTVTTGKVDFGSSSKPMVYYMMCDNDELYSNTCEWGSSGTLYGLMVVMEATLQITGGNGTTPSVVGAVFNGTPYKAGTSPTTYDIRLTGASTIAYNQAVIDAVLNTAVTTTTTITEVVPGSWQQLPVN
jgi:Tfp pilus assembly protein PilX